MSVPTVESAIHALATLGFVRVSRGVGIYVASPRDQTALLNYVWRAASIAELGVVRAAIDERAAPLVARQVATHPELRLPRTLGDINFFAHERSLSRIGGPQSFLDADLRFHRVVLASLRGFEIGPTIYERVVDRLGPALLAVADVQSADEELDRAHLALTSAILDGDAAAATRLARTLAGRELHSLELTLG